MQDKTPPTWPQQNPRVFYGSIAAILVIFLGAWLYHNMVTVENQGERLQNELEAEYRNTQAELSSCTEETRRAVNTAEALTDAQIEILEAAVTGRYQDDQGNSTSASGALGQGALFSAVLEAYPDLTPTGQTFQQVMAIITGCIGDFNDRQMALSNRIAAFENWRDSAGLVNFIGKGQFPTDDLEATIGDSTVNGQAALDRMRSLVLTGDAIASYEEGELQETDLFGDS